MYAVELVYFILFNGCLLECCGIYTQHILAAPFSSQNSEKDWKLVAVQGEKCCSEIFLKRGIFHQRSVAGVPQQNARVERKHRYLLDTARALKLHAGLPDYLWGECILSATHLINLLPSRVINWETPYKKLMKKDVNYDHLKVIGCLCYASPHKKPTDKFAARGLRCILIGYPHNQKGYKLLDLHSKKIFVSESAEQESLHTDAVEEENTTRDSEGISDDNVHQLVEERRPQRGSHLPKRYQDFILDMPKSRSKVHDVNLIAANLVDSSYYSADYLASLCNVLSVREPSHYEEACQDEGWVKAMDSEIQALVDNATWEMVDLPPDKKALDSKWVYKIKFTPEGHVDKLKARLVARGDRQVEGKDYKHTFSLVAKFASVRILIALATALSWPLHQLDINNAFLHGHLDEEVYLKPPKGFQGGKEGQVCRLKKSLYGLKQASRQWNIELTQHFLAHGYTQSKRDYSMFTKKHSGKQTIILVYVDDLLISGDDDVEIQKIKDSLDSAFTIKDLGAIRYFLGIELFVTQTGEAVLSVLGLSLATVFSWETLVSWKTKKQKTVSKSSTEAEYRCMSQTTSEIVWVHGLLEDLSFFIPQPIDLFCDNKSANHLAYNPIFHERTKHLKVDCHYVREHIQYGFLKVLHIKSFFNWQIL
ncbi:retrovirus-related Pol polyprotein from transposon RE1 [Beta vulgaris subsp. vulgaris]|uniref:retrovirus-related Pol polyprotein from transposon RE1 n=1 Tax=Beta vulgaris subsp. vulgaris TaxID=3555 RepID=UPI0025476277|nr:retrovirus-related Pol polyprotein from transposon RE1 [Beta vulgaris subsp. vulgaris]